jgi:phosphatidylinositol 3-kinase
VTVQLWADSKPLGVHMQTSYKYFKNNRAWNEWLRLPVLIKDCPISSQLAITIWDVSPAGGKGTKDHSIPFGGTTVPLFDTEGTLQKGRHKCKVYRKRAADGLASTSTPSTPPAKRRRKGENVYRATPEEEELERLERLFKKHEMNEIPRIDWLDKLVFKAVHQKSQEAEEAVRKRAASRRAVRREKKAQRNEILEQNVRNGNKQDISDDEDSEGDEDSERFTLYIEFLRWDFPIVFEDYEYELPQIITQFQNIPSSTNPALGPVPEVRLGPGIAGATGLDADEASRIIRIYDPEQFQKDNPCEVKHRRLIRSDRNGYMDRDLKPNAKLRDELNEIISYGPTQDLNPEEKDLVWRFRHHLSKDKRALTKFVKATNWQDAGETRQAIDLIPDWAEIDVDAALELLGPTFDNPVVRAYAVERLGKADDEELLLYLLQLVQALKFERYEAEEEGIPDSSLARFLINRATKNFILGSYLHWYLMVECDEKSPDVYMTHRKLFARVEYYFMLSLEENGAEQRKTLLRQGELIAILDRIAKDIRFGRDSRIYKIERLKRYLADPKNDVVIIDPPLPLPLDPTILITGLHPEESNVFKSSLSPLLITFRSPSTPTKKYPIIFKTGDDLRQDQLVIQIITLMDRLLQIENLDLKLTPYRILATASSAGAVQFIPSTSLSAISQKHRGSILAYLRTHNPDTSAPLGIRKETMDTYVKSCAGYSVITYILGVGDRHLENLLLSPNGHLFHIDFGFILGRDPKPFAPLIKIAKEMVEGLGGTASPQYAQFKQYCFTAYTTLRKSSSLVLNLFSLMVRSSVVDVRIMEEQNAGAGGGAVGKVRERFHLEMSEEEAGRVLDQVIQDSVSAVFGVVIDRLHEFVQGWRA